MIDDPHETAAGTIKPGSSRGLVERVTYPNDGMVLRLRIKARGHRELVP